MNNRAARPTVSVMIPYFNCKEYIAETVESVRQQSYPDIEIIIVDDGSAQEHADYLKNFLADKPDIHYAVQANLGVAAARNHAARLAKGKYFLFLDSDDLILPDYIEKCVAILEAEPKCKLVYPKVEFFDAQNGLWHLPPYDGLRSLLTGNRFPSSVSMHRAADFAAAGGFDENLTTHEDWDLWIRLLSSGGEARCIPEVLFRYRKRSDGSSLINRLEQNPDLNREDWQKVYEKNRDLFMQYHLGYSDCIQEISSLKTQNQELQHILAEMPQQTESLQQQIDNLTRLILQNRASEAQFEEKEKQINLLQRKINTLEQEKQSLEQTVNTLKESNQSFEQTIRNLNSSREQLEQHIFQESQRLAKYKGLWTVKTLKPIVKTEQAISSANRYRKGFRVLVREKGSIGKAYQYLRRHYKQTRSIKSVKQILKSAVSMQASTQETQRIQADTIPETFTAVQTRRRHAGPQSRHHCRTQYSSMQKIPRHPKAGNAARNGHSLFRYIMDGRQRSQKADFLGKLGHFLPRPGF